MKYVLTDYISIDKKFWIIPPTHLGHGTVKREVNMRKRLNNHRKGNILRVRAWNVRGLNVVGKLENTKREMLRLNLDTVRVSEVKQKKDIWSD